MCTYIIRKAIIKPVSIQNPEAPFQLHCYSPIALSFNNISQKKTVNLCRKRAVHECFLRVTPSGQIFQMKLF